MTAFRIVEILLVDAPLILRAIHNRDTGLAGVDVNSVIRCLLVEAYLQTLVIAGICSDLGSIERVYMVDDAGG